MDTVEIIRQLEADAGLRAQLRAVLLSDELLAVPERVARIDERVAEMDARLTARLDSLTTRLDSLTARLDDFAAVTDRRFEEVDRRLGALEDGVGVLKGTDLERRVREQPRRYLRPLLHRAVVVEEAHFDASRLGNGDADELWRVDLAVRGREPSSGEELLGAVEAAWRVHVDVLERAARRADHLARLADAPALPVAVSAEDPGAAVTARAEELGVALVVATAPEPVARGRARTG